MFMLHHQHSTYLYFSFVRGHCCHLCWFSAPLMSVIKSPLCPCVLHFLSYLPSTFSFPSRFPSPSPSPFPSPFLFPFPFSFSIPFSFPFSFPFLFPFPFFPFSFQFPSFYLPFLFSFPFPFLFLFYFSFPSPSAFSFHSSIFLSVSRSVHPIFEAPYLHNGAR